MGRKYIIFRAIETEEEGAENRCLAHTGAYTEILAEYFDSSNRPIPQPGYRPFEFYTLKEFEDPECLGTDTHYRIGDWEVVRVEEYPTAIPTQEFEAIVVCYCQYSPIQTPLMPMSKAKVSIESFGDPETYRKYREHSQDSTLQAQDA